MEHKTMSRFGTTEEFYQARNKELIATLNHLEDGMKGILLSMTKGELTTGNLKAALANLIGISEKGRVGKE